MKILNLIFVCICLLFVSIGCSNQKRKAKPVDMKLLTNEKLEKGKGIYRSKCMNCHLKSGKGVKHFYPPLADSDFLDLHLNEAIEMVKFGSNKPIKVNGVKYESVMPASGLTDKELVLVFNYILNSWNNNLGTIALERVESITREEFN